MEQDGGLTRVPTEQGHSRMGIASFVIAILATVIVIVLFVVLSVLAAEVAQGIDPGTDPQQLQRDLQNSPGAAGLLLAGLGILGCLLLYLVGLGLGIAGLIQGRRRKLFAVLGTVANGLALLAFAMLTAFSFIVGGA